MHGRWNERILFQAVATSQNLQGLVARLEALMDGWTGALPLLSFTLSGAKLHYGEGVRNVLSM